MLKTVGLLYHAYLEYISARHKIIGVLKTATCTVKYLSGSFRTKRVLYSFTMESPVTQSPFLFCMITKHEGFQGSIKNSAEDFVVIELDMHGRQVSGTDTSEKPAKLDTAAATWFSHKDSKTNTGKLQIEYSSSAQNTDDVMSLNEDEVFNQECFDLGVILGCSLNKALEEFTNTICDCNRNYQQKNTEMSLGVFSDKHQRAIVHRAVKHNYPFLMTFTQQTEIRVKEDTDFRELSNLVSNEEAEDFFRFKDSKVPGSTFTFLPDDNKEHRTAVHHFVNRRFGKLVETKSFITQGKTAITVRVRDRGRRSMKRTAADCDGRIDIYTAFTLRKENLETLEAISYMAALLGILPSDFSYAGIKDKRAITYQSMVVKKISPDCLLGKVSELEAKGLQLSNIHPVFEPLHLGMLKDNHFDIVIRNLKPHSSSADLEILVKEAVENVKTMGFVNYYGPQRFGNCEDIQTDQVGLALLKEDMNTAIRLFLSPAKGDELHNKAKQHFLHTGNAKECLALMPTYKARERLILRALHRYGSGPEGCSRAWLSLPHSIRVFYVHSYCSRVWNEAASFRLQTLGPRPVQGDLVWIKRDTPTKEGSVVHVVTTVDESNNVFSLDQVVLPMPGNNIKYPENELGKWYRQRLAQDCLDSCRFRITALKLNIPGCYRPLLSYPSNVFYSLRSEETRNTELLAPQSRSILTLSFDLDSSCYATVCLREIMKCDP